MKKFEYKRTHHENQRMSRIMGYIAEIGLDGWEMISYVETNKRDIYTVICVFKREKVEEL